MRSLPITYRSAQQVKAMLISLFTILSVTSAEAQTTSQNYILLREPRTKVTTDAGLSHLANYKDSVQITVQYVDGLGRPLQTVRWKGSGTGNDIVQPVAYDAAGREAYQFLPFSVSNNSVPGGYQPNALSGAAPHADYPHSLQYTFYQQTTGDHVYTSYPLGVTGYEPAPLDRPVEQGFPGASWQFSGTGDAGSSNHTVRTVYTANDQTTTFSSTPATSNSGSKVVALYTTQINTSTQTQRLYRSSATATYAAGQLYETIMRDENWQPADGCVGTTEEYKDKEGHVVLKRRYNLSGSSVQMLSTYYIYDDAGNLAFVLPPGAKPDSAWTPSQTVLDNLCYQYNYDQRGRVVAKKIPGKGWDYMIYNTLDQVVGTQDSVQRYKTTEEVSYTKYDVMGRPVMTGIYTFAVPSAGYNARSSLQSSASTQAYLWESRITTGNGYSNVTGPTSSYKTLTTDYYDDYNVPNLPSAYNAVATSSKMTRNMPTVSKTGVLNSSPVDTLWTAHYYDDLGRTVKDFKQHYLGGHVNYSLNNYDAITYAYNFNNQEDTIVRYHRTRQNSTIPLVTIGNSYEFDHMGRKCRVGELIYGSNGQPQLHVYLSKEDYNEVGQLAGKHYHSTNGTNYLGEVAYSYNERGWITSLIPVGGNNYYDENLYYDTPTAGATKQYNGNISQFSFNGPYMNYTNSVPLGVYNDVNYTYDRLDRLSGSTSTQSVSDETVSYDLMGNITGITRNGSYSGTYVYTYPSFSNKLSSVTKSGTAFKNYSYDGNGNVISDNSSPTVYTYNMLNLPWTYSKAGSLQATYVYDALGIKLRDTSSYQHTSWDYIDGIVYQYNSTDNKSEILFIATEEGKASVISGSPNYNYTYDLKDYLGNVRASFDANGSGGSPRIVQENSYYPFGLTTMYYNFTNDNRYLYNGKEKQTDLTDQYDYGARFYDAAVARFTTIDHLAIEYPWYTPYQFAGNRVPNAIDRDGLEPAFRNADGSYSMARDGQLERPVTGEDLKALKSSSAAKTQTGAGKYDKRNPTHDVIEFLGDLGESINILSGNNKDATLGDKLHAAATIASMVPIEDVESAGGLESVEPAKTLEPKEGSSGGPGAGKKFSQKTRAAAKTETNSRCVFCGDETDTGQPGKKGNTDHAKPKSKGGNNTLDNAQHTCQSCNLQKGAKSTQEYIQYKKDKVGG